MLFMTICLTLTALLLAGLVWLRKQVFSNLPRRWEIWQMKGHESLQVRVVETRGDWVYYWKFGARGTSVALLSTFKTYYERVQENGK